MTTPTDPQDALAKAIEWFEYRILVNDWGKPAKEQHLAVIKEAAKSWHRHTTQAGGGDDITGMRGAIELGKQAVDDAMPALKAYSDDCKKRKPTKQQNTIPDDIDLVASTLERLSGPLGSKELSAFNRLRTALKQPGAQGVDVEALKREAIARCTFDSLKSPPVGTTQWDTHQIAEGARRMFDYLAATGRLNTGDREKERDVLPTPSVSKE